MNPGAKFWKWFVASVIFFLVFFYFCFVPLNYLRYFHYLAYPKNIQKKLLQQNPNIKNDWIELYYNASLKELYAIALNDGIIHEEELKLIKNVAHVYGKDNVSSLHADFFHRLLEIPHWESFFDYSVPLEYLEEITLHPAMMQISKEEFYPVESPYVPVLMYHMLDDSRYWIDLPTFQHQLEQLFFAGFSTMRTDHFLQGDFSSVPDGRKPIILTFDDGLESQFRFTKDETPDLESGVGILEQFSKKYPEFGKNAVFYIYFTVIPFGENHKHNIWIKKLQYLQGRGFEIGNHTYDHQIMTKFPPEKIRATLDLFYEKMENIPEINTNEMMTLCYPGGGIPRQRQFIEDYSYKGNHLLGCFGAWGGKSLIPIHPAADRYFLPRYEANQENIQLILTENYFTKKTYLLALPRFASDSEKIMSWFIQNQTNLPSKDMLWKGNWITVSKEKIGENE